MDTTRNQKTRETIKNVDKGYKRIIDRQVNDEEPYVFMNTQNTDKVINS